MKVSKIKRILITRTITLIPCLIFIIFIDINKIMNLLNIIQFVQLPFVVIPLIKFVTNEKIMGDQTYKGIKLWILIFFSFLLQSINIYSIFGVISEFLGEPIWWLVLVLIVGQSGILVYLMLIKISGIKYEAYDVLDEGDDEVKKAVTEYHPNEISKINNNTSGVTN